MVLRFATSVLICFTTTTLSATAPPHMTWNMPPDGLIQLRYNSELRLNVKGGNLEAGHNLILWSCQVHHHEQFYFDGTQIKLSANPAMCLNVEGGVLSGHSVITWPCSSKSSLGTNEEFAYEPATGLIRLKHAPDYCLNIKEANIALGGELIVWKCESNTHELFDVNNTEIALRTHPEFHLNVAGANVTKEGTKVVLWNCHPGIHEAFELTADDGRIHLKNSHLCLNAEGGVRPSHKIIVWPCAEEPADNELFTYDHKTGLITATTNPMLGFNAVGGRMLPGDEIVLWSVKDNQEL